jgi:hypothetical protein
MCYTAQYSQSVLIAVVVAVAAYLTLLKMRDSVVRALLRARLSSSSEPSLPASHGPTISVATADVPVAASSGSSTCTVPIYIQHKIVYKELVRIQCTNALTQDSRLKVIAQQCA